MPVRESVRHGGKGPSPHRLHTLCSKMARPRPVLEPRRVLDGGERLRTDASAQAGYRTDHAQQRPRERHTRTPGTGLALSAGEPVPAPQPVRSACMVGLRPDGWQCWMCGQPGRADPVATAYFCCDGCDVRWYGGTRRPRHSPQFSQREYTWWMAGKLARIRYIDHAAEHTASPA